MNPPLGSRRPVIDELFASLDRLLAERFDDPSGDQMAGSRSHSPTCLCHRGRAHHRARQRADVAAEGALKRPISARTESGDGYR